MNRELPLENCHEDQLTVDVDPITNQINAHETH